MHQFVRDLITEWRRLGLPVSGETVVVAVSGGADSLSLLLALDDLITRSKLGHRLVAAHFNHGLRGDESDNDEDFVRAVTKHLKIGLAVGKGRIPSTGNLEQNARTARYAFLSETASSLRSFAVLTGHTINDQAETFLMNLLRGSGPTGLAGMHPVRALGNDGGTGDGNNESSVPPIPNSPISLVRPLLTWAKRQDTEGYCHDCGVEFRYDTMNEDTAFKRVRIRKVLMPLLEDFNPKIVETLANTAQLMRSLAEQGNSDSGQPQSGELGISNLKDLSEAELETTLRGWLGRCRGTTRQLELKHIRGIARLALSRKSGRTAELPGGKVVKTAGKLTYHKNKVEN